MEKSVMLSIVLLAVLSLTVPMAALDTDAVDSLGSFVDYQEDPIESDIASDYYKEKSMWGVIGLIGLVGFVLLVIYLEHKGILKDPWIR